MHLMVAQGQIEVTATTLTLKSGGIALTLPLTTPERQLLATALLQVSTNQEVEHG